MGVRCFMVRPTERCRASLRRYWGGKDCGGSYHNAETPIGELPAIRNPDGYYPAHPVDPYLSDPRWPAKCDKCGAPVPESAERRIFTKAIYTDDSGKEYSLCAPVPGMMWDAWWMGESMHGPEGKCLVVICPDGTEWMIDGCASNCTMPNDRGPFDKAHRCWVRHGEPPNITVDKNGRTCSAGGGSIVGHKGYHGFLRNGEFT